MPTDNFINVISRAITSPRNLLNSISRSITNEGDRKPENGDWKTKSGLLSPVSGLLNLLLPQAGVEKEQVKNAK